MKKTTLKVLVLALAVLFPMQNVFAEYCTNFGNSSHAARYLNAFTLTDGTNEAVVSSICTSTGQAVYHDKTSVVLETEAGATISFSSITWNGEWMHGYAFADFNNDGTFDAEDVVSYNFYSATDGSTGQNSKGETVSNNCNVTAANMPEWTIPATLAPGDYRFRFKIDWCNLDPCGASDIAGNGGAVVDVTIRIASQAAARTISVSASPAEAGTVTINGEAVESVTAEGSIALVATPAEGYKFVNWTLNGEEVSTKATYVDGTEGDKAYVANFAALEMFTVNVTVNDATMGEAASSIAGQVYEGTEITLIATPAEGFDFANWTLNGEVVSTANPYTTTITTSAEYVANFKVKPNKLQPTSAVTTEEEYRPIANIIDGSNTTYFESWDYQKNGASVGVVLEDINVIEKVVIDFGSVGYIPNESKIQVMDAEGTWVDVENGTITKGSNRVVEVNCNNIQGSQVQLVIVSKGSAYFVVYEFEVYGKPLDIPARTITVSTNDETMGSAYIETEGTTEMVDATAPVKLYAVANEGYEFVNWTLNGEVVSTEASIKDATEGDKAYVANFVALATYTVSVSANDAAMGSATISQEGEVFKYTEVTLTATANEGYEFVNWTVNGEEVSLLETYTVSVVETAEYVANFRQALEKIVPQQVSTSTISSYYDINAVVDGNFTTNYYAGAEAGTYVQFDLAEETLIGEIKLYLSSYYYYHPNSGKIQVSSDGTEWTDVPGCSFAYADITTNPKNGQSYIPLDANGVSAKYVRVVTDDYYYYEVIYYTEIEMYQVPVNVAPRQISVSVNDASMGTAYVGTESVTSVSNQTGAVRIVATATEHAYRFVNWTVNGEEVATTPTFVDRTEGDKAYVANFEAKPIYTVGVSSATAKRGSATCDAAEVVYEGDVVTFTATPTDGYGFISWTVNGEVVSTENPYALEITESVDLVANFDVNPELNRSAWSVYTVSSEYAGLDGGQYVTGDKAIDGSTSTYWHTDWDNAANKKVPQWIVFDLGAVKSFDSFNYLSRSESQTANGNIGGYQLYVSDEAPSLDDLTGTMTMVNEGTFTYPGQEHQVELGKVAKGRYVMLYATSTYGEGGANQFANCAEFYLYLKAYSVTVSPSNPAQGTAYIGEEGITSADCSVEGTDVVTITAVPATGYQFVNWTLEGEVVSTEAEYTTTAVTEGRDYVANFEFAPVAPRTITAAVNNASKGSVVFLAPASTETSVVSDSIVVMEAVPATTDDFFVNWTINGVEVSTETTYEYLGAADVTIQANFISKYVVTVNQELGGTISVKSGESFIASGDRVLEGNYISLNVTENVGNELKKLYVNGEDVYLQYKYNPDYCVQVNGTITITVEYGEPVCYFTYECTGNGYVEAWEYDTYDPEAEEEGTLELPVSPDGAQYAYGAIIPFGGTAAIFVYPGAGETLLSLTINGEEIDLSEEGDLANYGDYFIDPVEKAIHVVAEFTGEYSGVENAEATATNVYAVAGGIVVEVAETATASIYSIAGVLVSEQTVSEKATIAMEKGVYIVKVADKVSKVIVK